MGYLSHLTSPKFRQESSVVARGQMVATKKDEFFSRGYRSGRQKVSRKGEKKVKKSCIFLREKFAGMKICATFASQFR
jgi:hypothetical protein